ncbi:hypothetical protein GCM10025771_20860 [Niveibacterium umoris]|uniref:LysM domain-containing protein n=1 Tax=Niveibacterium umoris TaxID=1193620 RepID=A0A840BJY7_9RHOO|nr:hypothetical protein [Niveibacterium umoris]MBB4012724.1 hypothetical protein [Niveibacterium umoris]
MTERNESNLGRHALFLCLVAIASVSAQAAGLGEAALRSGLSQPLRVEIPLVGESLDTLGAECFRLHSQSGTTDDLPWVRDAQTRLEQVGSAYRLVVTTRYSIHDPAIMLGVVVGCGSQVRREYALLLGPAVLVEAPRAAPAAEQASSAASPRGTPRNVQTWTAAPGESAASISSALAPRDRAAQRRITREIVRANPELYAGATDPANARLEAGTELKVPSTAAATRAQPAASVPTAGSPPSAPRTETPKPPAKRKPVERTPAAPAQDRLTVTSEDVEAPLRESLELEDARRQVVQDDSTRARLRREQQLILAIDDRIATTLELNERIRQLEAAQQKLQAENERLAGLIARQPSTRSAALDGAATPNIPWKAIALATLAMLLAIGAWVAWRRRRIQVLPVVPLASTDEGRFAEGDDELDVEADALTAADIWPERDTPPPLGGSAKESLDWSPPTISPGGLGPSSLLHIDDEVEEHDSAVELAEIMMSFGRVQGAAETLAEFIRANPKQAVRPWIKLLEVYKAAAMRVEFDALAGQLNKTFNVKAVTWDEFDEVKEANESVEQMPHIIDRIVDTWRTRDCQRYLHTLLRDNRKGTRQGFPLGIVDDILCLNGVLEIELGAFKPTSDEIREMESPSSRTEESPPVGMAAPSPATAAPITQAPNVATKDDAAAADFHLDAPLLPENSARQAAPEFIPERTESMIEFNLDEDLPPLKPRDQ